MKTKLQLLLAVLLPLTAHAADDTSTALQKGLFEEEANQNLPAAIQAYQSLLAASDEQRKLAATALFRLGECYRKLGQTNDAAAQYRRLLRDYADQTTLATLSRQNLTGLGVETDRPRSKGMMGLTYAELLQLNSAQNHVTTGNGESASPLDANTRAKLRALLQEEIQLAEKLLSEQRKRIEAGTMSVGEAVRFERDVLGLKRQLVGVDGLSTPAVRQRWRELMQEEITLAEQAVQFEQKKVENGQQTPVEVSRAQRELMSLKRELVAFDAAPPSAGGPVEAAAVAAPSPEAEELALSERLLAQLQGWDLSQLRKLIPTLSPDADMERLEKLLAATEDELRTVEANRDTADSRKLFERLLQRKDQLIAQITHRADVIVAQLEKRITNLRERVARQSAQTASARNLPATSASTAPTDEEDQEIRRIQALIKDSPDLINAVNVEVAKVKSGESLVPKNGTLLHKAANQGQLGVARFLIEHGADVAARDEMGRTPLHRAAGNGHRAMVELLLANKADANAAVAKYPDEGSTALHLAVSKGYRTVCETLLARGADPNLGDASGTPPIYPAVWADDAASVRLLLAKGAKVNPEPGKKGYTPLHTAKSTNVATMLIHAGAAVDALNDSNQSPLHYAAGEGRADVVAVLLAAGANPNLKDKDGKTALFRAALTWKANVVALLIAKGANPNERSVYGGVPLDELIRFSDNSGGEPNRAPQLETLQAFLAGGADPNLTAVGGAPHLFRAVSEGLEDQAETLLKAGADPNAKSDRDRSGTGDLKGQTPLIRALRGTKRPSSGYGGERTRSMAMVNLLLGHKADPNLGDGNGVAPIFFAMGSKDFRESAPFVEALLKRGANIETRDSEGMTPLARAVTYYGKETVELLFKHKADPNAKTRGGTSPLHFAARNQNMELVDILLAAGADANALDADGRSALDYVKGTSATPQAGLPPLPPTRPIPNFPGQPSSPPKTVAPNELADRLRKAGARDWAPRPGQITATRRSSGTTIVAFSKGTNDWNRHSLLEVMGFTFFGSGSSFPFPDFSKLTITRLDPASGQIKEFTVDLPAKLAAEGCKADQWLEWGDLIDIPEGEHRLDVGWGGLPEADIQAFARCLARKVTITVKGKSKEIELSSPTRWMSQIDPYGIRRNTPDVTFGLRQTVLASRLLLTSSDTTRVKVKRTDAASGQLREWTFDLSKEASADDFWLRDGDVIEVPEKP